MRVPAMHGFPNRTPASTETPWKTSIVHLLDALQGYTSNPTQTMPLASSSVIPRKRAKASFEETAKRDPWP